MKIKQIHIGMKVTDFDHLGETFTVVEIGLRGEVTLERPDGKRIYARAGNLKEVKP